MIKDKLKKIETGQEKKREFLAILKNDTFKRRFKSRLYERK